MWSIHKNQQWEELGQFTTLNNGKKFIPFTTPYFTLSNRHSASIFAQNKLFCGQIRWPTDNFFPRGNVLTTFFAKILEDWLRFFVSFDWNQNEKRIDKLKIKSVDEKLEWISFQFIVSYNLKFEFYWNHNNYEQKRNSLLNIFLQVITLFKFTLRRTISELYIWLTILLNTRTDVLKWEFKPFLWP